MKKDYKEKFIRLWQRYFNNLSLPLVFYYSDWVKGVELAKPGSIPRCLVGALTLVENGRPLALGADSLECLGGQRYLGFRPEIRPDFEFFLSSGIPGKMEGERYKKTPALVKEIVKNWPSFKAPKPFIIFKRWDQIDSDDEPEVVIFFSPPDVLSGLFTLANYDEARPEAVIAPMGSGCSSIVTYPYLERDSANPRAVIGLFDPSARPYLPEDRLSFAVPMAKFIKMVDNMEESFLITATWKKIQARLKPIEKRNKSN